jgi:hypothetical protein
MAAPERVSRPRRYGRTQMEHSATTALDFYFLSAGDETKKITPFPPRLYGQTRTDQSAKTILPAPNGSFVHDGLGFLFFYLLAMKPKK